MSLYKDPLMPIETRIEAAKAALPYEKPRLAEVEMANRDGGEVRHRDVAVRGRTMTMRKYTYNGGTASAVETAKAAASAFQDKVDLVRARNGCDPATAMLKASERYATELKAWNDAEGLPELPSVTSSRSQRQAPRAARHPPSAR